LEKIAYDDHHVQRIQEIGRQPQATDARAHRRGGIARQLPDRGDGKAREKAMSMVCALIGTTMVARAVDDPKFSAALCDATTKQLSPDAG